MGGITIRNRVPETTSHKRYETNSSCYVKWRTNGKF